MDHIFVDLHVVAAFRQRAELEAELVLRARHFVVMLLRLDAHFAHDGEHFGADVLRRIHRRHRESSRP